MRFAGRRALVTGASQGIGSATVTRLIEEGAEVWALARNRERLDALAAATGCTPCPVDLSDRGAIEAFLDAAPPCDLLVNCAGLVHVEPFVDTDLARVDETLQVNTVAPLRLAQRLARGWIEQGTPGVIVNVSSIASTVGTPGHAAYCASKAGLDALTRVMAIELGPHGIRVNSVNPVVTLTPMAEKAWADPDKAAGMKARIPLGRFVESEEVAATIAYLLSSDAAMVHGVCLDVDGGFKAG
ncbi:SDR family oxidoreductase [Salinisphaera hydrothermalis]|uniref:SDR family oxidoreductase n=1 Tax=Salinisphaera hydrothermalis TaxID=563188 RepID=UPI00055A28B4